VLQPYIGVAGVTTHDQRVTIETLAEEVFARSGRKTMIGVLGTARFWMDNEPPKYPARYPPLLEVPMLFSDSRHVINAIHFASADDDLLAAQLHEILEASCYMAQVVQLNRRSLPPLSQLQDFRQAHPDVKVLLQISRATLDQVGRTSKGLVLALRPLAKSLDGILLDESGGTAHPFSHFGSQPYLEAIRGAYPDISLAIAGGFGPLRLDGVYATIKEFSDVSWDAETGLRDQRDALDLSRVEQYLRTSALLPSWT
jgi:hypothetical protein